MSRGEKPQGVVLWQGQSKLTGHEIAVIVTGIRDRTKNPKTGDMLQAWILRADIPPHEAVKTGQDVAVCGTCPLASGHGCYVLAHFGPLQVWKTWKAGGYATLQGTAASIGRFMRAWAPDRNLRIGAYGDPAAPPAYVWARAIPTAPVRTGYTHAWETPFEANLQTTCMASVHTHDEADRAQDMGYRTFRTGPDGPREGEIVCPATKEGGEKTVCARCGLCDGKRNSTDRRKNIFAYLHGSTANRALIAIGG
jgi:hypothetical protein